MMIHLKPSSGAHVGANASVSHIMWQVMLALMPGTAFGLHARSQAPAWECGGRSSSFVCQSTYIGINDWKLELPRLHSQAGAWERAEERIRLAAKAERERLKAEQEALA